MPNRPRLGKILALGLVLGVMGCSGGDTGPDAVLHPNEEFVRLIEDARYEIGEGNPTEAGRLYNLALEIDRDSPWLWVEIARFRFRNGEHVGALEAADYAVSLDPEFAPALLMRAQLVRDAYGLAESLPWFERALALHPDDEDLLAEYAGTLGDLGRHRDMLTAVRKLAEVNSRDPRVHYLQAVLAVRANNPVLASSLLKRSGWRDDGVPAAIVVDALIEMQQGNYDSAATGLERLLVRQPGNIRVMELFARALWLNGRDREIVDRFAERAAAADASPYLIMLVGRSMERLGDRRGAVPYIERALAADVGKVVPLPASNGNPAGLPLPTFQIRQFLKSADPSEASRYAAELLATYPQSSDIMVLAGDAALARQDNSGALAIYGEAAQIRRPWPLTKKIIHAYRAAGDGDAADALLMRHVRSEPMNTEALIMLAQRSAEDEDWLRVTVLLDTAIKLGAGNDLQLIELRAKAARELGEDDVVREFDAIGAALRPDDFLKQ